MAVVVGTTETELVVDPPVTITRLGDTGD